MSLNVHNTHCCYHCGCKYGDPKCPVANGTEKGIYCEEDHNTDTMRLNFFEKNQQWFRYSSHPSMDGKYPCWIVWTPKYGTTQRKTLREAIDAAMEI